MAAWLRLKHPELVSGAIASSAPVLAKLDFAEYFEVVDTVLGLQCDGELRSAMKEFTHLLMSSAGKKEIQKKFNFYWPLDTSQDVTRLVSSISGIFAYAVQYKANSEVNQVSSICSRLLDEQANSSKTALDRLADIYKIHDFSNTNLINKFNLKTFFGNFSIENLDGGKCCFIKLFILFFTFYKIY